MAKGNDFSVKADVRRAQAYLKEISPRGVERATSRTINRVLSPAKTAVSKGLRARVNLKARDVKPYVTREKASVRKLYGRVNVSGKRQPLHQFSPRLPAKRGAYRGKFVTVEVLKGQRMKADAGLWGRLEREGFTLDDQHENFFAPWGKDRMIFSRRYEDRRYPIDPVFVEHPLSDAYDERVRNLARAAVDKRWPTEFRHNIQRELDRAKKKARRR